MLGPLDCIDLYWGLPQAARHQMTSVRCESTLKTQTYNHNTVIAPARTLKTLIH